MALALSTMTFDQDNTEYGRKEDGIMRSLSATAIINLTRTGVTERERAAVSEAVRYFFPTGYFFIRTPGNDAYTAWRWFAGQIKRWEEANAITHPMNMAIRFVDLLRRQDTEVRHPIAYGANELLDRTVREYKTIVGQVRALAQGVVVEHKPWLPEAAWPDSEFARTYTQECRKLQATKAGRKAKRLLLDHLSAEQVDSYMKKGYFFVSPPKKKEEERPKLYVVERGQVCANIMYVKPKKAKSGKIHLYPEARRCLIAKEPHPIDDILLTQKLTIETDEDYFLKEAETFNPYYPDQPFQKSLRAV